MTGSRPSDTAERPGYDWKAQVVRAVPDENFELELCESDEDWLGTRVGFVLEPNGAGTLLRFHHRGWKEANDHFVGSNHCWALYLRLLRRYVEHGERVPCDERLRA